MTPRRWTASWFGVLVAAWGLAVAIPSAKAAPALIDRIEIEGVKTLDPEAVEAALEIEAGETPDELRVNRSSRNLQGIYRSRGFEEARVSARLRRAANEDGRAELVLAFQVEEGTPTRIAGIRFVPRQMRDRKLKRYWESVLEELNAEFPVAAGDRLEQEKLTAARRAIQDALASEEFVGSGVEEVRNAAQAPSKWESEGDARWVELEFRIDLGERVTFGFRGNSSVPAYRLNTIIDEQRLVGFGNDYLRTIRARIEEEYRAQGFALVKVETATIESESRPERHATFLIDEGPRVRISSISFEGNRAFPADVLRRQLLARAPAPVPKGVYSEKSVEAAAGLLVEWLKSRGYLDAKLLTINRDYVPEKRAYDVVVYLYEGEQTLVQDVKLDGFRAIPESEARRILRVESGKPFDPFAFSEGLELLKLRYRSFGYLDARIVNESTNDVVRYAQENRFADVRVEMEEGVQFRAGKIEIAGLEQTRREVVERELRFREGDILEESRLTDTEAALRKLGLFGTVNLQLSEEPGAPDRKRIRVALQEGTPGVVGGGVGYRTDLGARLFGQAAYSNLFQRNHTVLLNTSVNRRFDRYFCDNKREGLRPAYEPGPDATPCALEYQIQLGYLWPWFGLGDTTFRPLLTIEDSQYLQFDAKTQSLALTWERPMLKALNLTALFTYGLEHISQVNVRDELDEAEITIGSITPAVRVDLRDNPLSPTRGFFGTASFEWASRHFILAGPQELGGDARVGYTRFQLRSDYYVPVTRDITWFVSFRAGLARNLEPPPSGTPDGERFRYQIPLIKQFTLGGAGSVRGFSEQEINRSDQVILGTISYVNYRTQLDLPFSGPLRFGPFLDAGNVQVDRFSFGNLRLGTGVSFRYVSPVGPVNFDYGFKLAPLPGEGRSNFYFSIGIL